MRMLKKFFIRIFIRFFIEVFFSRMPILPPKKIKYPGASLGVSVAFWFKNLTLCDTNGFRRYQIEESNPGRPDYRPDPITTRPSAYLACI